VLDALPPSVAFALRNWKLQRGLRRLEASVLKGVPPVDALSNAATESFERHLRQLIEHLRAAGVEPVLITYPTLAHADNLHRYRYYLDGERTWRIWFSASGLLDVARRINDVQRRVALQTGTPLVDADQALPRDTAFFADDVHLTDRGAQFVAELVADVFRRSFPSTKVGKAGSFDGVAPPLR
jgi:lysophospholipase L1-like esterase